MLDDLIVKHDLAGMRIHISVTAGKRVNLTNNFRLTILFGSLYKLKMVQMRLI